MKSLGTSHWLLGSSAAPPTSCLAFDGQSILLSEVRSRDQHVPVIRSGSIPRLPTPALPAEETEDPGVPEDCCLPELCQAIGQYHHRAAFLARSY